MFPNFTSETYRVVNDVYTKDTEETYSYILTYLYSKTTRIHRAMEAISEKSAKELKRGKFGVSRKLILMILENFSFMFYAFDTALLKLLINCLDSVDRSTAEDFQDVFRGYVSTLAKKTYKNEKQHRDLFVRLCSRDFKFDQRGLVVSLLGVGELFVFDYEAKFSHFNQYLHRAGGDRKELVALMLGNANLVNAASMFNHMIHYAARNNFNVVEIMAESIENRFLILRSCNLVLEGFLAQIPTEFRDEEKFSKGEFFYSEITLVIAWGSGILRSGNKDEQVEESVKSFLNLFKAYYSVRENRVLDTGNTVPSVLVSYFKTFLANSSTDTYRLVLKKVFQGDFITSKELTTYSRTYQGFMLQMMVEDKKSFHDTKLFILLGEIFSLVGCFRNIIAEILTHFLDKNKIFGEDEDFNAAFESKLRMMYFMSKNDVLRGLLEKTMEKRRSERTAHLLEDQKNKMMGKYTKESFDITSDMVAYEKYTESSVRKYGKSLKSSINLEKVGMNRKSRLKFKKDTGEFL